MTERLPLTGVLKRYCTAKFGPFFFLTLVVSIDTMFSLRPAHGVSYDNLELRECPLQELDAKNSDHKAIKWKICEFCRVASTVQLTKTALTDLGLIPLTKAAVLEALHKHVESGRRVYSDRMDNGDITFVTTDCSVGEVILYIKVRFYKLNNQERMLVISAHPPRRW
jgi:hypothetical protein